MHLLIVLHCRASCFFDIMDYMPSKQVTTLEIEKYAISALKKWLKKAMSVPEVRKRLVEPETSRYQVDLSICTVPKMAKINFAFRKIQKPTDILSFPTHEFFQRQGVLGDLVICGPVALKQASEIGHTWKKEIDVLLVHGILHLFQFDHEVSDKEAKLMGSMESRILGKTYRQSLIERTLPELNKKAAPKKKAAAKKKARTRAA